jgi:hypothetical protein
MDAIVVGIDVSKDKLDIALLPQGETFTTSRDAGPIPGVQFRLRPKGTPPAKIQPIRFSTRPRPGRVAVKDFTPPRKQSPPRPW